MIIHITTGTETLGCSLLLARVGGKWRVEAGA